MFNRLKEVISKTAQQQTQAPKKRIVDVSFLGGKQIDEYKKIMGEIKESVQDISQIVKNNRQEIKQFVKQEKQKKQQAKTEPQNQQDSFTFEQDLVEIKTLLGDVIVNMNKIQQTNQEIKDRAKSFGSEAPQKVKELQEIVKKYELQLKNRQSSDDNNKEILVTLKQQTQLLSKQTKQLQQKNMRIEKQLSEKSLLAKNLQDQKKVLLQMRNIESNSTNPQVQELKLLLQDAEKKTAIQRTKLQQKEKEIETLKKKMEEDRDSLQKIADQLKEKELKSKKILDKYQRSKTQIRKYRQQKTEFIKKLNIEIANLNQKVQKYEAERQQLFNKVKFANQKNQGLQTEVTKNEGKGLQLESARNQLKLIRQEQMEVTNKLQQKQKQNAQLKLQLDQLQAKRKSLLQALQKPINHEIRTLDKIIRALQKLYKQYIQVVFTQGNIIGFQTKISYILSNVVEIKEDLKL